MTNVYPDSWALYAELNGSWVDLTQYTLQDSISLKWGISGNKVVDRVADTGELRFILDNQAEQFLPDVTGALSGWKLGVNVKFVITWQGLDYVKFKGRVDQIRLGSGAFGWQRVYVTALDWMDYAAKYPISNPGLQTDQTGDDVLTTVLGFMPVNPDATDFDTGVSVFPTTFDTVTSKTKATSEFAKVALSEPGFVYLRKDREFGETLVFENNTHRNGWQALSNIRKSPADSGALLLETGDYLLLEDGGKLLLDEVDQLLITSTEVDSEVIYGENVINRFTVYANPRKVDTSAQVLFTLNYPIAISSGETIEIRGTYADPAGGLPISGQDMITPSAIDGDYEAWTNIDATGTDITADLVQVSTVYGTEGFTHTVRNDNASAGYITTYKCRGYGIYIYNPVERVETDSASIAAYSTSPETLNQKYQVDTIAGAALAKEAVFFQREPQTELKRVIFFANRSETLMQAAMDADIGFKFRATLTRPELDTLYHIQQIRMSVQPGGVVVVEWLVRTFLSLVVGLSPIAVEFGGSATKDGINFGTLPKVYSEATPTTYTVSAWVYIDQVPPTVSYTVLVFATNNGGFRLGVLPTTANAFIYSNNFDVAPGQWNSDGTITPGEWVHVAATYDTSSTANDAVFYINGVQQTTSEVLTPAGSAYSRDNVSVLIGNAKTASEDYNRAMDGKIKDVRVYNRILTSNDIDELYNASKIGAAIIGTSIIGGLFEPSLVTDGLVFQAPCVRTSRLSEYIDETLTDTLTVIDNVYRAVGKPNDAPIGRTP